MWFFIWKAVLATSGQNLTPLCTEEFSNVLLGQKYMYSAATHQKEEGDACKFITGIFKLIITVKQRITYIVHVLLKLMQ